MDRLVYPILIKVRDPEVGLNSEDRQTIADLIAFYDHTVSSLPEDSTHAEVIAKAARRSGLYRVRLKDPRADRDYGRAIRLLDQYARRAPTHIWLRTELIDVLREYAEELDARDRTDDAEKVFRQALAVAEPLLTEKSATYPCFSKGLVKQFDPLARSLATRPSGLPGDLALAVRMAEWAVEREPAEGGFRRTLGLCRYRTGDWASAAGDLEESMKLSQGGEVVDWLLMAMTQARRGEIGDAHTWHRRARGRIRSEGSKEGSGLEVARLLEEVNALLLAEGPGEGRNRVVERR